jgi:CspA family cold shock protein
MSERVTGIVKWFDGAKGYGFITRGEGEDIFVHYSAIRGEGHRSLYDGQKVEFDLIKSQKGMQAQDVSVLADAE